MKSFRKLWAEGNPVRKSAICIGLFIAFCYVGYGLLWLTGITMPFPSEPARVLYGRSDVPITLYSLIPNSNPSANPGNLPTFHKYPILGKTQLTAAEASAAFQNTVYYIQDKNSIALYGLMCSFTPRHGVEFERNGKHYTILICFQCSEIEVFCDGHPMGMPRNSNGSIYIDSTWIFIGKPDNLNAVFLSAGIPINDPFPQD